MSATTEAYPVFNPDTLDQKKDRLARCGRCDSVWVISRRFWKKAGLSWSGGPQKRPDLRLDLRPVCPFCESSVEMAITTHRTRSAPWYRYPDDFEGLAMLRVDENEKRLQKRKAADDAQDVEIPKGPHATPSTVQEDVERTVEELHGPQDDTPEISDTGAKLLSPTGVAELKECDPETVRKAVLSGELPALKVYGANDRVTGYAIWLCDAFGWAPRKKGRPARGE